ncbi:MAG: hypothetical protein ABR510_12055 [Trueperaceae bacterium]
MNRDRGPKRGVRRVLSMVALTACMRKLLTILDAITKSGRRVRPGARRAPG